MHTINNFDLALTDLWQYEDKKKSFVMKSPAARPQGITELNLA